MIVHHDLHKVEAYFDEVILLNKELIAAGSVDEVFTSEKSTVGLWGDHWAIS